MPAETQTPAAAATETSDVALTRFFETSSAARKASAPLKKGAEVGVLFTDVAGDFRFTVESGVPRLHKQTPRDPDFVLTLGPGAVRAICAQPEAEVGELGVLFFQHIVASDPAEKIKVRLHSGLIKLTLRGYLGVLAQGGGKVISWMAQKGLKGPGAVASAISRLRK